MRPRTAEPDLGPIIGSGPIEIVLIEPPHLVFDPGVSFGRAFLILRGGFRLGSLVILRVARGGPRRGIGGGTVRHAGVIQMNSTRSAISSGSKTSHMRTNKLTISPMLRVSFSQ